MDWATIYEDGSMSFDGYVPTEWRLMGINSRLIAYHSPGGTWWDNGGRKYGPASIEVREIEELRRGNEPGTWRVKLAWLGPNIHFHPTPKHACRTAAGELAARGDRISANIADRKENDR